MAKGTAPKTSLRPKSRSGGKGLGVRPKSREEGLSEKDNREASVGFGNTEFRWDLDNQLSWNPLARLGFDPAKGKTGKAEEGGYYGAYIPKNVKNIGKRLEESETLQDFVGRVEPDDVMLTTTVADAPVWSHEYTHRGIRQVDDFYKKDPEAFEEKYGKDAVNLLKKLTSNTDSNERATELLDDLTTKMTGVIKNMSQTQDTKFTESELKGRDRLQERLKDSRVSDMWSLSKFSIDEDSKLKGFSGILLAAEDVLKEKGEPPRAEELGFFGKLLGKMGFAEGGEVMSMKDQMNLFEYGGLADDGMEQEPVTGNEIPPGSMAKEVRDDVPAMLSEGEYVVPADVVRYYGVKFFEDLRGEAKAGMGEMEENGRIGGEPVNPDGTPVEMDLSEEEMQMLQQLSGDVMTGMAVGGSVYNTNATSNFETRQYVNVDTGEIRPFEFLNGQPIGFIPANFIPATEEAIAKAEAKMDSESKTEGTGVSTGELKPEADGTGNKDARDYDTVAEPGKGFLANLFGGGKKSGPTATAPTAPTAPGTKNGPTGPLGTPSMPGTPAAPTGITGTPEVPAGTAKEPMSNPFSGMPNSAPTPSLSGLGDINAPSISSPGFPSIGLDNAYSENPNIDIATDFAVDMMALNDAVTKGSDTLAKSINDEISYANPPSNSANLTGIMGMGTNQGAPNATPGTPVGPSIAAPSISGAMSAALGGFGTSKGGEYSGTPTAGDARGGYGNLAGMVGPEAPSNAPSGNYGGGNPNAPGGQSSAGPSFGSGRGGEFGGGIGDGGGSSGGSSGGTGGGGADSGGAANGGGSSGGSSGGDAGTGSDNDGDGFGDMGGISGGWNTGGLVSGYQDGGSVDQPWQQPPLYSAGNPYTGNPYNSGGFESRQYVNSETGEIRVFQFLNGQPIGFIPEGFVPATQQAIDAAKTPVTQTQGTGVATGNIKKIEERGGEPNQQQGSKDTLGPIGKVDFSDPIGDAKSALEGKGITGGIIGGIAGALFGVPTLGARAGSAAGKVGNIAEAVANSEIADILGYDTTDLNAEIDKSISKLGKLSGKIAQNQVNQIRGTAKDKFFEELRNPTSTMQFDLEVSNFQSQEAYQSALDNLARSVEVSQGVPTGSVVAMGRDDPDNPSQFGADFAAASAHAEANPTGQTTGQPLGLDDISLPGDVAPDSNGDGGDSATVICTALHNLGLLDSNIYKLDADYGRKLEETMPEVLYGYRSLATPLANYIQEETVGARITRSFVAPLAKAWAKEMAHQMQPDKYKGNYVGKAIMSIGYPICAFLGKKEIICGV
jgi:hypothetical protein